MRNWSMLLLSMIGLALPCARSANAGIDVGPDALTHYSHCVSQAKDRNFVSDLGRSIVYRCHDDIAASYFNYLGRRHVPDHVVNEINGVFVYRPISGVGRCWNKIADENGLPISTYGCEIIVEM